jgi:hypothetical protein
MLIALPKSNESNYLLTTNPTAIIQRLSPTGWFLVSWAMCHQSHASCAGQWWQEEQQRAYFSGVPKGKLLVLDLDAYIRPIYPYTEAFYGHDFIWSMVCIYACID